MTAVLLGVFMFASNFLNTNLFGDGVQNFTVWFVLSVFAFACGWLIQRTLGWVHGGKVVFAVIVASSVIGIFLVSFFSDYFGYKNMMTENLILYTLRNIMLGSMGFFGMAVAEAVANESKNAMENDLKFNHEELVQQAKRESELIINEAKLKSDKIMFEAKKQANSVIQQKEKIETQLKELIQTEKELINKYESEE